jgi:hypothetical protein
MSFQSPRLSENREEIDYFLEKVESNFFQASDITEVQECEYKPHEMRELLTEYSEKHEDIRKIKERRYTGSEYNPVFANGAYSELNDNEIEVQARKAQMSDGGLEVLEKAQKALNFSREYQNWEFNWKDIIAIPSILEKDLSEKGLIAGKVREIMDVDKTIGYRKEENNLWRK